MISFPGSGLRCEIDIVMFVGMEISWAAQAAAINEEQNTCLLASWLLYRPSLSLSRLATKISFFCDRMVPTHVIKPILII